MGGRKLIGIALALCLLVTVAVPAMAADPQMTLKDLKGIKPSHHRYLFSVLGGAAIGAGIGAIVGSGNDITKGLLLGGGGLSALYLHSHRRDTLNGWRSWAYVGSYTAFGGGLGWTLCGCKDGLGGGLLIGGGAAAVKAAWNPRHTSATAITQPPPPQPRRRRQQTTPPASEPSPPPPED